jgi:hypothetical protein
MATLETKQRFRPSQKAKPGKVVKRCPLLPSFHSAYYVIHVCMCPRVWGHGHTARAGNTNQHIHMFTQIITELPRYASHTHNYVPTFYRPWNDKSGWKLIWPHYNQLFLKATFKYKFLPHTKPPVLRPASKRYSVFTLRIARGTTRL